MSADDAPTALGDLAALLTATEMFVAEDAEGGRRGQALAAAVLDCRLAVSGSASVTSTSWSAQPSAARAGGASSPVLVQGPSMNGD